MCTPLPNKIAIALEKLSETTILFMVPTLGISNFFLSYQALISLLFFTIWTKDTSNKIENTNRIKRFALKNLDKPKRLLVATGSWSISTAKALSKFGTTNTSIKTRERDFSFYLNHLLGYIALLIADGYYIIGF